MKIYLDLFFIFNIIIDAIIIMGVSSILKRRTNNIRIIICSLIGGISSLLMLININRILIEIISVIIMCLASFGYKDIVYLIKNILYFYIISLILGGLLYMFNIKIDNNLLYYLVIIVIGIEVTILYVKEMKKMRNMYNNYYKVDICFDKDTLTLTGFVDTGNNLYDPYKKRPIILIGKEYERNDNYFLVPYHTISGDGLLKCIKPKYVNINGNNFSNVLVGFSDNISFKDGIDVILHKDIMRGE